MADTLTATDFNIVLLNKAIPSNKTLADINNLLGHLTSSERRMTLHELHRMLLPGSPTSVYVAHQNDDPSQRLVAMGSIALYRVPTGVHGYVEDVVTDPKFRGYGLSKAINLALLKAARKAGATEVNLTSRRERVAAWNLYDGLGYVQRDTGAFKFTAWETLSED